MKFTFKTLLCLGALTWGGYSSLSYSAVVEQGFTESQKATFDRALSKSASKKGDVFRHDMQLYLADAYGFEVPGTSFWISVNVLKEKTNNGHKVTLQLPSISFITGPYANNVYEINNPVSEIIDQTPGVFLPPLQNGGYLYTKKGFLPEELRPTDVLPRTWFAATNNGQNLPFSYILNAPDELPGATGIVATLPSAGYLLRVTNSGGLVVEGIGTIGNLIPQGTQQLLATDVSYFVRDLPTHICRNKRISTGAINVAQFTLPPVDRGNVDYVRDHHVNDAFDNVVAYAWTDNSNISPPDPTIMNLAYSIGKVKDGKLKMGPATFLPTPDNGFVWDSAIAINRTDPNNIVLSYLVINKSPLSPGEARSVLYAAVSFDGGETWPINAPTNVQPTGFVSPGHPGGAGDLPGARCDKFGNFWYMASNIVDNAGNETNVPFIMVSSDKGQSWTLVFTFPFNDSPPLDLYDYPSFCFGGDGEGNYGVHIVADFFPNFETGGFDGYPAVAFIPVTGLGSYGTPQSTYLTQFLNNIFTASITASEDGRVWTYGEIAGLGPASYPFPGGFSNNRLVFKSPGALDVNYAGPWGVVRYNTLASSFDYPIWEAAPVFGFFQSVQTNLFDEGRQALYVLMNAPFSELSNNSNLYLLISRDNGLTWSRPFLVNTTKENNRGFPSMALDTVTNNLLIGWYDCRDYADGLSFNYYGAVVESCILDKLIREIPQSNPLFSVPAGGYDFLPITARPFLDANLQKAANAGVKAKGSKLKAKLQLLKNTGAK